MKRKRLIKSILLAATSASVITLLTGCVSGGVITSGILGGVASVADGQSERLKAEAEFERKKELMRLKHELGSSQALNSGGYVDCYGLQGAKLVSHDGTFLGKFTNKYSSDSVLNEYGDYGSRLSGSSIWNDFSDYGSEFSNLSAFNIYARNPPFIIKDGAAIGKLTINESENLSINTYLIKSCDFL